MVIYLWVILKEIITNTQQRKEESPHNTYPSTLLIACSDLEGCTLHFLQSPAPNKMIFFTTSVFRCEREEKSPLGDVNAYTENNPDTKKRRCVLWAHTGAAAAGEITAHDKHPQCHYFCRTVNSDFLPVELDQMCPAARTGTDGESLVLSGGPELVAGLVISVEPH